MDPGLQSENVAFHDGICVSRPDVVRGRDASIPTLGQVAVSKYDGWPSVRRRQERSAGGERITQTPCELD